MTQLPSLSESLGSSARLTLHPDQWLRSQQVTGRGHQETILLSPHILSVSPGRGLNQHTHQAPDPQALTLPWAPPFHTFFHT
ncbi:unnamed protein product [Gulo gulo]|uniref:Uncharacterized protein n=1 Tax=Gulo gulo TaxID=48420 RepID=A0A9X9LMK6_GULGU|nr:unnamed protein product [Gulo gulo]